MLSGTEQRAKGDSVGFFKRTPVVPDQRLAKAFGRLPALARSEFKQPSWDALAGLLEADEEALVVTEADVITGTVLWATTPYAINLADLQANAARVLIPDIVSAKAFERRGVVAAGLDIDRPLSDLGLDVFSGIHDEHRLFLAATEPAATWDALMFLAKVGIPGIEPSLVETWEAAKRERAGH